MKNINEYLKSDNIRLDEATNEWVYYSSVTDPSTAGIKLPGISDNDVKWLLINTETESISCVTEDDLKQWTEDFEDNDWGEKEVKALKIGESYDSDGGINIYIRIK